MPSDEVTFLRCQKCHCEVWSDIPEPDNKLRTRFSCARCSHTVVIGACSGCKTKNWEMISGIDPKGPHRPVYRLKCRTCGRVIGARIDSAPV